MKYVRQSQRGEIVFLQRKKDVFFISINFRIILPLVINAEIPVCLVQYIRESHLSSPSEAWYGHASSKIHQKTTFRVFLWANEAREIKGREHFSVSVGWTWGRGLSGLNRHSSAGTTGRLGCAVRTIKCLLTFKDYVLKIYINNTETMARGSQAEQKGDKVCCFLMRKRSKAKSSQAPCFNEQVLPREPHYGIFTATNITKQKAESHDSKHSWQTFHFRCGWNVFWVFWVIGRKRSSMENKTHK